MISKAKRAAKKRRRKERRATEEFKAAFFSLKNQEVRRVAAIRGRLTFKELPRKRRRTAAQMGGATEAAKNIIHLVTDFVSGKAG